MKIKNVNTSAFILYFFAAISMLAFLYLDFFGFVLSRFDKVAVTFLTFLFVYSGSLLRCRRNPDKAAEIMYGTFFLLFIFYLIVIADFTLIDGSFGRNIRGLLSLDKSSRYDYLKYNVNVIPFATVKLFVNGYKEGLLKFSDIFENIVGNLLVFCPLGFFLPLYFKKSDNFLYYFVAVFSGVLIIEALQLLFAAGAFDVDDIILNVSGAVLFFLILKIKRVSRFFSAVTFGAWGDKNET